MKQSLLVGQDLLNSGRLARRLKSRRHDPLQALFRDLEVHINLPRDVIVRRVTEIDGAILDEGLQDIG